MSLDPDSLTLDPDLLLLDLGFVVVGSIAAGFEYVVVGSLEWGMTLESWRKVKDRRILEQISPDKDKASR